MLGASPVRGLTSLFLGLRLGLIGIDLQTGQPRFTFGVAELLDGIDVVIVAVGLFAVGETLYVAARRDAGTDEIDAAQGLALHDARGLGALVEAVAARHRASAFRSAPCRPAAPRFRPSCPTRIEKKLSQAPGGVRHSGAIEGVAGPEAANNASAAGVLVPLLTLGLPTSATAAIMLGGVPELRHPARPAAVRRRSRRWCGA